MYPARTFAALLALLPILATPALAQSERTLTTSAENHHHIKLSPDGNWVAFMRGSGLALVPFAGGSETPVVDNLTMSPHFLWTPSGTGLIYQDGNVLRLTTRDGGTTRQIGTVPGLQRIWDTDSTGTLLFGVRRDASVTRQYIVFSVPVGGGAHVDLVDDIDAVDDVDVDPSNSWLLFRTTALFQWQFWRTTITGTGRASFGAGPFALIAQGGRWAGPGDRIVFYGVNAAAPQGIQIASMDFATAVVTYLSAPPGTRFDPVVTRDTTWLLYEFTEPTGGLRTVRLLPVDGGGELRLSSAILAPGPVTVSGDGKRVAYGGTLPTQTHSQVRVNELDAEVRVSPRLETGKVSMWRIPAAATDTVIGMLSVRLGAVPITVPPFTGAFELDAGLLFFPVAGVGEQVMGLAVPSDASLIGATVYVQGLRVTGFAPPAGGFTRPAGARVF